MEPTIIHRGRGPEIAGTRITVYDVYDYLTLGWHHTEIAAVFRVSSNQVLAAAQYIDENRAEVESHYQRIVDRHRNHQYSPEVVAKIAHSQQVLQDRQAEIDAAHALGAGRANDHGGQ